MNKRSYDVRLNRLNETLWAFTCAAQREITSAVEARCAGRTIDEARDIAKDHADSARKLWIEAEKIATQIWSDLEKRP